MDIKGKLERHVTGRIPHGQEQFYKVPFARAVYKACDVKEHPPKTKHIRRIILETHNVHGGISFYREMCKRPIFNNDISAWKALITTHRVLMEGHVKVLKDSTFEVRMFEDLKATYSRSRGTGYSSLNVAYCDFLLSKISFHAKHPIFDGTISLENYLRATNNQMPDENTCFEIITNLLDHQDAALKFVDIIFNFRPTLNMTQVFAFIPLVLETYAIYSVITYFMKQLVSRVDNMELFDFLTERYYGQYMGLRDFYFKANNIIELARVVPIPMLPVDPPRFVRVESRDLQRRRRSPSAKAREREAQVPQPVVYQPPPQPQPPPQVYQPPPPVIVAPPVQPAVPPGWTSFQDVNRPTFVPTPAQQAPPPKPKPEPVKITQPAPTNSFFMQLMGMVDENKNAVQKPAPPKLSFDRPAKPAPEPKADDSDALKRANEEIARLKEENQMLLARMKALEDQNKALHEANGKLTAENHELKNRIEQMLDEQEEEKRRRMLTDLEKAYNAVDSYLFNIDSPANMGNQNATAQVLLESSKKLADEVSQLLSAVQTGKEDDIRAAIARLIELDKSFLDDAKGCSQLLDNADLQDALLRSARGTSSAIAELLRGLVHNVNDLEDWNDVKTLEEKKEALRAILALLEQTAGKMIEDKSGQPSPAGPSEDMESIAEQELLKAAKIIEEAARQIATAKAKPRPPKPVGQIDVTAPIMDAASAITDAAARLIHAAAEAQKERVAMGQLPNAAGAYKRDPTWAEGLVSAAKYVAMATQQMVAAANDTVEGKMDDAALIAASKAVAAGTAQLVAASRSKADTFSKSSENLVKASQLVKTATDQLVEAARAAGKPEPDTQDVDFSGLSMTDFKIKQMNQAAKIIELEKELAKQNEVLRAMRKAEYQGSNPYAVLQRTGGSFSYTDQ